MTVAPRSYPEGLHEKQKRAWRAGQREGAIAEVKRTQLLFEEIEEVLPEIAKREPGVFVADGLVPVAALVALRLRVPAVLVHTTFFPYDDALPPLGTSRFPRADGHLSLMDWWDWMRVRLGLMPFSWQVPFAAAIARYWGLSDRQIIERFIPGSGLESFAAMSRTLPNLVACVRELDFPHAPPPNVHYTDALINPSRSQAEFDTSRIPEGSQVAYLSMGTQAWIMKRPLEFFRKMFEVVRARPRLHLIVSTGRFVDVSPLAPFPPNVEVHERVPQLAVLAVADVVITHAGLNTVKECITASVPMLCFPVGREQPGNAARVAYHGLGLSLDYRASRVSDIGVALDQLLSDPWYARRTRQMADVFAQAEARDDATRLIRDAMASRALSSREAEGDPLGSG